MKRKNLSLKLAALLLACGGFGAVLGFANSVYAMDSSDGFNSSEEKKQNEVRTSLVPAITIDDINNHYSDLKLEGNLSETPDRYLNFFREYVINEHLGRDPKVAENLKSGVLDFAKTFYHDYLGEYHAYLEKIKAGFEQKSTDLNTNSVSAPINSINNEPSGDMLPANINDASDKQIQKFIQFLAYKQNIGGLDDFVGYDFKEVAKRYYDEYAAKYNEYVKKNKTGVEPKKINSISVNNVNNNVNVVDNDDLELRGEFLEGIPGKYLKRFRDYVEKNMVHSSEYQLGARLGDLQFAKLFFKKYIEKYRAYLKNSVYKTGSVLTNNSSNSSNLSNDEKIYIPEFFDRGIMRTGGGGSDIGSGDFLGYYKKFCENGEITKFNFKKVHFECPTIWSGGTIADILYRSGYNIARDNSKNPHFSGFADEEVRALYDHPLFGEFMERLCKNCGLNDLLATIVQITDFLRNYWSFMSFEKEEIEKFESFNIKSSCVSEIVKLPEKLKEYAEKMQKEYAEFLKDRLSYGADFETIKKVFRLAATEQFELVKEALKKGTAPSFCDFYHVHFFEEPTFGLDTYGYEMYSLVPKIYDSLGSYYNDFQKDRAKIKDFMDKEVLISNSISLHNELFDSFDKRKKKFPEELEERRRVRLEYSFDLDYPDF